VSDARDMFAATALREILATHCRLGLVLDPQLAKLTAESAWLMADAMMAERKKREGNK
jgi:hypothetical protein